MKLSEIIQETQLDEKTLKQVLAGAMIGVALGAAGIGANTNKPEVKASSQQKHKVAPKIVDKEKDRLVELTKIVDKKYKHNIQPEDALKIVSLAIKHENSNWKAEDILALIGIESSFNKNAKSNLKRDPAIGLTQIRPIAWRLKPSALKYDIEKQISKTYEILDINFKSLGNKEDALHAYNVGLNNVKNPDREGAMSNPEYYQKWARERKTFTVKG